MPEPETQRLEKVQKPIKSVHELAEAMGFAYEPVNSEHDVLNYVQQRLGYALELEVEGLSASEPRRITLGVRNHVGEVIHFLILDMPDEETDSFQEPKSTRSFIVADLKKGGYEEVLRIIQEMEANGAFETAAKWLHFQEYISHLSKDEFNEEVLAKLIGDKAHLADTEFDAVSEEVLRIEDVAEALGMDDVSKTVREDNIYMFARNIGQMRLLISVEKLKYSPGYTVFSWVRRSDEEDANYDVEQRESIGRAMLADAIELPDGYLSGSGKISEDVLEQHGWNPVVEYIRQSIQDGTFTMKFWQQQIKELYWKDHTAFVDQIYSRLDVPPLGSSSETVAESTDS